MAQLNLLPDVKLDFIQTQNRKKFVLSVSTVASAIALAIFIFLLIFVGLIQKHQMKAVDKDINSSVETLKSNPDLDKILTVQNQLSSLPGLHNDKAVTSMTFDYLKQLTPINATISEAFLDMDSGTLNIKGSADALKTINKFADTLKFTTFKVNGQSAGENKAFSNVVLKSFNVEENPDTAGNKISYELEMNFDPAIFANSAPNNKGQSPVELVVPKIISTRSATQTPNALFAPKAESGGQ